MTRVAEPMNRDLLVSVPKILLHDHLDGGLRVATLIDLAAECGYDGLPADRPGALSEWFLANSSAGGLPGYLSGFTHTTAVMQSGDALVRVAEEAVIDLAADGVIYAEVRFAPELHLTAGLDLDQVVDCVLAGLASGTREAATQGHDITVHLLLSAMRQNARSSDIARLAIRWRDGGVVGFDLAGPELGFPIHRHREACAIARSALFPVTLHAGEADGHTAVSDAVLIGQARRIGHGVRVIDDVHAEDHGGLAFGAAAGLVRDRGVALEVCPTSNRHTGVVDELAEHPIDVLRRAGFLVTVNTDNRLMSQVTLSGELASCAEMFDWSLADIEDVTVNAAHSAFCTFEERVEMLHRVRDAHWALVAGSAA